MVAPYALSHAAASATSQWQQRSPQGRNSVIIELPECRDRRNRKSLFPSPNPGTGLGLGGLVWVGLVPAAVRPSCLARGLGSSGVDSPGYWASSGTSLQETNWLPRSPSNEGLATDWGSCGAFQIAQALTGTQEPNPNGSRKPELARISRKWRTRRCFCFSITRWCLECTSPRSRGRWWVLPQVLEILLQWHSLFSPQFVLSAPVPSPPKASQCVDRRVYLQVSYVTEPVSCLRSFILFSLAFSSIGYFFFFFCPFPYCVLETADFLTKVVSTIVYGRVPYLILLPFPALLSHLLRRPAPAWECCPSLLYPKPLISLHATRRQPNESWGQSKRKFAGVTIIRKQMN